jgi:hypothetical protein
MTVREPQGLRGLLAQAPKGDLPKLDKDAEQLISRLAREADVSPVG